MGGLFLRRLGMGWRRRQRLEEKTEKMRESKLKPSLASYESEDGKRAVQMAWAVSRRAGRDFV